MEFPNRKPVHPHDVERIKTYLEKKGLYLDDISVAINGFAIANVSLLDFPEDPEEQRDFNVIIDLSEMICYKFNFFGHRTDGLRIYNKPNNSNLKPEFNISFINSSSGSDTPYILVTYLDFEYYSEFDDGNYNGKIYATILNPSVISDYNPIAIFDFEDCRYYRNSIKVYFIEQYNNPGLFAYRLISNSIYHDYDRLDLFEMEYEALERGRFDGIWDARKYTNKRIIPLEGEDFYEKASAIIEETRKRQREYEDKWDYD